ncbi:hypothetical protein ACH4MA_23405 [Streptomyces roseolus]|uniref:hypothetical protein n=1 Tax=Streptomyces roseolus TaxID=67358 RepID=UPI00379D29EF
MSSAPSPDPAPSSRPGTAIKYDAFLPYGTSPLFRRAAGAPPARVPRGPRGPDLSEEVPEAPGSTVAAAVEKGAEA